MQKDPGGLETRFRIPTQDLTRWLSDLEIPPRVLARIAQLIRVKTLLSMPRIKIKGRDSA
jgi:hypothetical protein